MWETCKPSTQAPAVNIPSSTRLEVTLREVAEGLRHEHDKGIGVDCEDVANIDIDNLNFIERNFTQNEIDYCRRSKTVPEVYNPLLSQMLITNHCVYRSSRSLRADGQQKRQ
jgi:hypothetical protein